MAIRNIRLEGDEILKKKSREVEEIDDKLQILIDDMIETMHKYNGVGLAAVQVGILKRVIVTDHMFIIGKDSYFEKVDKILTPKINHTIKEYSLLAEEKDAIFLRYSYQKCLSDDYGYKFKRLDDESFHSHIDNFLYLVDALALKQNEEQPKKRNQKDQKKSLIKQLNTL